MYHKKLISMDPVTLRGRFVTVTIPLLEDVADLDGNLMVIDGKKVFSAATPKPTIVVDEQKAMRSAFAEEYCEAMCIERPDPNIALKAAIKAAIDAVPNIFENTVWCYRGD